MESDVSAMHSMQGKSSTTLFKDLVAEYLFKEYRGGLKEQGGKLKLLCSLTALDYLGTLKKFY